MSAGFPGRWAAHIGGRVPRYTSYPTADRFTPSVRAETAKAWLAALDPAVPLSLYVHVPFCKRLCLYCGCNTQIVSRRRPIGDFVDALVGEIDMVAEALPGRFGATRVHLGGGTPTALAPAEFSAILRRLRRRFDVAAGAEIAVEIDPRGLGSEMISALADAGVTRASLGVQDFDPGVQRAINRLQPYALVADAARALRGAGIAQLSFDLIYGLPLQTAATVERTADQAASLRPDRVALFGYAHVPWLKPHQKALERHGLPGAEARWNMARAAEARLAEAGYRQVGMDHFALPGDALAVAARAGRLRRNFQGYTDDDCSALLAFGPSGISALPQGYVQSPADTAAWRGRVGRGELAAARGIALGDDDRLRRAAIEQLMCDMHVDLGAVARRFGRDAGYEFAGALRRLAAFEDQGIVGLDGLAVRMIDEARPLVRAVAAAFDAYLTQDQPRHAVAV
ncbi:MAG: oxygen-independent coproporphyrinogen III oxidase [Rhodospirillales bacterium]